MYLGIDVGGTHTDGILFMVESDSIQVIKKTKTQTADDVKSSLLPVLEELLAAGEVSKLKRVVLSTTLATNAILQRKTPPVALLLLPGPGANPAYSFFGEENRILDGYVDHRGTVVQEINTKQVRQEINTLRKKGFQHFGVVGKFSVRNPVLELAVAEEVKRYVPNARITLGHAMSGKLNFPRRAATCYLNSATMDVQKDFMEATKKLLEAYSVKCPVYILKADGGTYAIHDSSLLPAQTIQSGVAASIMGAYAFSKRQNGVIVDIGGTTTDIGFLVDGSPLFLPQGIELKGMKTLIQGFLTISVACGGDSCVRLVDGDFKIGPERKGPAVAFGGEHPTPTDAMIVQGLLEVNDAQRAKAFSALQQFVDEGFEDVHNVAGRILDKVCEIIFRAVDNTREFLANKPVFTVHQLLQEFRWDMQMLWGMGGASIGLLPLLGRKLGLEPSLLPCTDVTNALGAAVSRPTAELNIRIDSAKGMITFVEAGLVGKFPQGKRLSEKELEELALVEARSIFELPEEEFLEITERESFNVIRGFSTLGQIHHVRVQIRPESLLKGGHVQDV